METTFTLIATYNYRENYALLANGDADTQNPHWKNKGHYNKVVAEGITVSDVLKHGSEHYAQLVNAHASKMEEANGYTEYTLLDFVLCERSDDVVAQIQAHLESVDDDNDMSKGRFIYNSYELGITEEAMAWGLDVLAERGVIKITGDFYMEWVELL